MVPGGKVLNRSGRKDRPQISEHANLQVYMQCSFMRTALPLCESFAMLMVLKLRRSRAGKLRIKRVAFTAATQWAN
jgi:hypothetical protein